MKSKLQIEKPSAIAVLLIILIVTSIIYLPSLNNGWFNWDDPTYVINNLKIQTLSFQNFRSNFTDLQVLGTYQPLSNFSYMLDYQLWGDHAKGYHLTNLILHLFNGILVFAFVKKLGETGGAALFVSALFLLHPMHVESVVWISERKDVLYAFFYLLALIVYLSKSKRKKYWVLFFFLCAMLSKVMALTLPIVLLALDLRNDKDFTWKNVSRKWCFFLMTIVMGGLGYMAQKEAGAVDASVPVLHRSIIVLENIGVYLFKFLIPIELSVFHPFRTLSEISIICVLLGISFLIMVAYFTYRNRKSRFLFGSLLFIVSISPVLQIIPFGSAQFAERYTYLAYIGLSLLLVELWKTFPQLVVRIKPSLIYIIVFVFISVFGWATHLRIGDWKSNIDLWSNVIMQYPKHSYAYVNLSRSYKAEGELDRCIAILGKALLLNQDKQEIYIERALLLEQQKEYQKALDDYDSALSLQGDHRLAMLNKSKLLASKFNRKDEAIDLLNILVKGHPKYAIAYLNLGVLYEQSGFYKQAHETYSLGVLNANQDERLYRYRAVSNWRLNNQENAIADLTASIYLNPNYGEAYWIRSNFYFEIKKYKEAYDDALLAKENKYLVPNAYFDRINTLK